MDKIRITKDENGAVILRFENPLRFRIGEFWRLHSRGVLFLSTFIL